MSLTASPRRLRRMLVPLFGLVLLLVFSGVTHPAASNAGHIEDRALKSRFERRLTFDDGASLLSSGSTGGMGTPRSTTRTRAMVEAPGAPMFG